MVSYRWADIFGQASDCFGFYRVSDHLGFDECTLWTFKHLFLEAAFAKFGAGQNHPGKATPAAWSFGRHDAHQLGEGLSVTGKCHGLSGDKRNLVQGSPDRLFGPEHSFNILLARGFCGAQRHGDDADL
jgi:hypothetical protein